MMRSSSSFALLLVAIGLAACSGAKPDPSTPSMPSTSTTDASGREVPRESPECAFVTGDKCFTTADAACASAGCAGGACLQAESHPVQVSCKP